MKQTKQVLIIPTEKASGFYLYNNKLFKGNFEHNLNQHFYIVSNEKIKDEDWCIRIEDNKIIQCKPNKGKSIATLLGNSDYGDIEQLNKGGYRNGRAFKKIIATTDRSLLMENGYIKDPIGGGAKYLKTSLPQIPEYFINKFIERYNSGSPITEVTIEYETKMEDCYSHSGDKIQEESNPFIKVNPKDNTIETSLVENNPMGTYIAVFVDGEYKNILIVQAEDIDDADGKLREQGWEDWSSLKPVEYDNNGIYFAINGLK